MADSLPDNPLPPCPSWAFNCVRGSRGYDLPPDALLEHAEAALLAMEPTELDMREEEDGRIHAVFTVFVFQDDVTVAIGPHAEGAVLHIRSASRVGPYDFGVNRRRVQRFFRRLEEGLQDR